MCPWLRELCPKQSQNAGEMMHALGFFMMDGTEGPKIITNAHHQCKLKLHPIEPMLFTGKREMVNVLNDSVPFLTYN